jgi:CRP-like cAMP-binding protein
MEFFSGLDGRLLDKVARSGHVRTYRQGEAIVRAGEVGLGMYGILAGKVKVEREVDGVARQVAELGPPQFFAEIAIIDDKPRSATVIATEDTECLLLTRDSFLTLAKKYPELTLRLAKVLALRLRATQAELAQYQYSTPQQLNESSDLPVAPADAGSGSGFTAGKSHVQRSLLDTFQQLYLMRAMVRFSVALVGCPVEGFSASTISRERVGETKVFLLPAPGRVALDLGATNRGAFTLHIFTPRSRNPLQFGPIPIQSGDRFRLRLNAGSVMLRKMDDRPGGLSHRKINETGPQACPTYPRNR